MLKNKVIIFDDSCPMCKLYTYWFVAWGFLKPLLSS
jgi:predicted DCC family thiol-disulfide oxidoreductase YuxK